MRKEHLKYLACPRCKGNLDIREIKSQVGDSIETGLLQCTQCSQQFDIARHIPRFAPRNNYADGFGFQWTLHAKTQYDSFTKTNITQTRFFAETKWPRNLEGQVLLEVGSGSGRFTEQAASTGAMVISLDYSCAVDANYSGNADKPNVLIVQGDIYNMPFRENIFDRIFCLGVLQHTPDVEKSFMTLPGYLKQGGHLAVDVYVKHKGLRGLLVTKYWVRPLTKKMSSETLYKWCDRYINFMWPVSSVISKIPVIGTSLNWKLLIPDYRSTFEMPDNLLKEWAILDTFDMLSPAYDSPQTLETFTEWFKRANLTHAEVHYGYNGIEGRGIKS